MGVGEVMVGSDGGFLDGSVHAFELTVGPRAVGLGQAVIDAAACALEFEGMVTEYFPSRKASHISAAAQRELPRVVKWVCKLPVKLNISD